MRIHRFRFVLALLLALAMPTFAPGLRAQADSAQQAAAQPGAEAPVAVPATPASASSGLPAEQAPPRTLRAYTHVWVAFTIAWLLLFGYVISVGRRFARLEREVEALRG
ncbi:MAG TPA: CcmD family protein [Longimicrobiaceae bacterium]|nr:CcmD family protein [Longimicrobiaceae bacterium]